MLPELPTIFPIIAQGLSRAAQAFYSLPGYFSRMPDGSAGLPDGSVELPEASWSLLEAGPGGWLCWRPWRPTALLLQWSLALRAADIAATSLCPVTLHQLALLLTPPHDHPPPPTCFSSTPTTSFHPCCLILCRLTPVCILSKDCTPTCGCSVDT
jgi:hypothetical protein